MSSQVTQHFKEVEENRQKRRWMIQREGKRVKETSVPEKDNVEESKKNEAKTKNKLRKVKKSQMFNHQTIERKGKWCWEKKRGEEKRGERNKEVDRSPGVDVEASILFERKYGRLKIRHSLLFFLDCWKKWLSIEDKQEKGERMRETETNKWNAWILAHK